MTGIERLRELGREQDERSWSTVGKVRGRMMLDIADQIERELREKLCESQIYKLRAMAVYLEMNTHVLGHEGMEDSPVARWARELREALGGDGRDHAEDVSMSAYDLLPEEDREAIAWVREHGGLDAVRRRWECLSYYADPVPRSCMEKCLARLQRQIDESHAALRRRNERIKELNRRACDLTRENAELRKRAMPDGMEWPRFESGEPVRIGDVVSDVEVRSVVFRDGGILLSDCTSVPGWGTWRSYKEPIKRPAPKVLDADGAEIRVGDEVYLLPGDWCDVFPCFGYHGGEELEVFSLHADHVEGGVGCRDTRRPKGTCYPQPSQLTHRAPVLAADGEPLEVGQTVWDTNGDELVIGALEDGGHTVTCRYVDVGDAIPVHGMWSPSDLTHERPVLGADGKPLRVGETVYAKNYDYVKCAVLAIEWVVDGYLVEVENEGGHKFRQTPDRLTHERPVADTWERLEKDAGCTATKYNERRGTIFTTKQQVARDLVRRCRALAERERGER